MSQAKPAAPFCQLAYWRPQLAEKALAHPQRLQNMRLQQLQQLKTRLSHQEMQSRCRLQMELLKRYARLFRHERKRRIESNSPRAENEG